MIAKNDVRAKGNPFTDLGDGPTGGESLGALGEWLSSSDDDCGGLGAWEDEDDCQHSVGASLLGPGCWHWGEQEQSRVPQQLLAGGRGSEKGKEGVGAKAVRARPAAVEQDGCCSGNGTLGEWDLPEKKVMGKKVKVEQLSPVRAVPLKQQGTARWRQLAQGEGVQMSEVHEALEEHSRREAGG